MKGLVREGVPVVWEVQQVVWTAASVLVAQSLVSAEALAAGE